MARARAIETRLEKLVPALDEYYSSGFLTRDEILEVSRQRTHWEYRLVAKPLLLLDVRGAITYELGLEKRLREYCNHTKLNLQHRWDIVERMEGIYKIGLKHLKNKKEHESLRQEYVLFLKNFQRNGSLSNLYGELMVTYPRRADIWVEAAEWQCTAQHNTDNARAIVQQALLTMASEPTVWACALRVELQFVQRLLDGLLAEHREESRKARKKAEAKAMSEDGDEQKAEQGTDEDANVAMKAAEEPTSVIAPKLRAENASMGQVLLDLALAKAVVEEAFDSPASGALLEEQLLSTAGAFAFAKEVMELIVATATRKMLEACFGTDASPTTSSTSARDVAALSIVSQQQQLRVRTQWRHRQSIDLALAAYLSLEDALVNRYPSAVVDTTSYLADGGSEAVASAHRRKQQQHQQQKDRSGAAAAEFTFANPSPAERRRAAAKSLVAIITFSCMPEATVAALPAVTDVASTQRFAQVRQALTDVLRRLADSTSEGVSKVCAALLQGAFTPSDAEKSSAKATTSVKKNDKKKQADAVATDVSEVAKWVLQVSKLDKETQQACVEEPVARARQLADEIASAASTAPPPTTRARTEAANPSSSLSTAAGGQSEGAVTPLLTWSVTQLERFLHAEDREVLRTAAAAAGASAMSAAPSVPSSSSASAKATTAAVSSPLTAEDVERFIVWWKEEEAQLQQTPIVSASEVAASQARRRMAVVDLLHQHGLLPDSVIFRSDSNASGSYASGGKGKAKGTTARQRLADTDAWAAAQAFLLNRATALQCGSTAPSPLPLSTWRIYSALETMVGPLNPNAPSFANGEPNKPAKTSSSSDSDSDSDDENEGNAVARGAASSSNAASHGKASAAFAAAQLTSFAAAGLYFLSGVPSSTLDRAQEWVRLEGVTSLLRCRLASWLGRGRVCTRDTVVEVLRGATPDAAEGWVADLQGLLSIAQRCQPLPRYAQTHCIVPFLEGVAVYRSLSASAPSTSSRERALQAAREAHEALLKLYGVSKHPESFVPLVYDGTPAKKLLAGEAATAMTGKASTAAVQQANTEDWVAYVVFERVVSKDLLKAKTVIEQGRRSALSPQQFMVKLNAL